MAALMTQTRELVMAVRPGTSSSQKGKRTITEDDMHIKSSTETLRRELEILHNRFDQATEDILVDSIIYEMQALQMRYKYYLDVCKERGIVSEEFSFN